MVVFRIPIQFVPEQGTFSSQNHRATVLTVNPGDLDSAGRKQLQNQLCEVIKSSGFSQSQRDDLLHETTIDRYVLGCSINSIDLLTLYEGEIIGFAAWKPYHGGAHLTLICVSENHQGCGACGKLLNRSMERYLQNEGRAVSLLTRNPILAYTFESIARKFSCNVTPAPSNAPNERYQQTLARLLMEHEIQGLDPKTGIKKLPIGEPMYSSEPTMLVRGQKDCSKEAWNDLMRLQLATTDMVLLIAQP